MMRRLRPVGGFVVVVSLAVAGCGSDGGAADPIEATVTKIDGCLRDAGLQTRRGWYLVMANEGSGNAKAILVGPEDAQVATIAVLEPAQVELLNQEIGAKYLELSGAEWASGNVLLMPASRDGGKPGSLDESPHAETIRACASI